MYSKVKSCVRSNNSSTKLFPYYRGLRQGCLLSPILFAMFLNDLNEFLLENASGVRIWDEQICAMLYADALILFAESENDLRIQMNQLGIYSNLVRMEVSQKKTKVVVFSKTRKGIPKSDKRWKIGEIEIDHDEVKSYKYLGVIIRNNGTFTEHVSVVKDKAIKAYYTLIAKNREWQGFSPKTFLHIFDHTILPILNYAADVWGGNEWPDLERIHLMACKLILGVNQATPSNAIYTEPGRYPLETHRKISMIKYIKRFENLPDEKLEKKLLNS